MIMGHSKHERSTKKHVVPLKKLSYDTLTSPAITATSPKRPLSSVANVAVVERFDCIQYLFVILYKKYIVE